MTTIRSLVENKSQLDYKALALALVQEFGVEDKVEWESVIPAQIQKELFGGEILRLFKDHKSFAGQKDVRAIHRSKGETSQLLILAAIVNDEALSKHTIERITKKFIGGQAVERYVVWFLGNPQQSIFKVVLSGKEGKKVVLKTLPFGIDQPYFKTYDFILNEVSSKVHSLFAEPNEIWKALWKAFDISIVNKQFYKDIKTSFTELIEEILAKSFIKDPRVIKHFAIRIMGRLIFCWFLKKKGIISDEVLSSKAVGRYNNYYKELLEKLFFDVFNTPLKERIEELPEEIKYYPFLNGGLFENQKEDYKENIQLYLPNKWFYNLFNNTLEKYNFTIDENTSSNAEIAIDPEMLGRIFENLLAEQNPETQDSARKSTGSYYTPREIVDYMVEQSLIEYLKTNIIFSDKIDEISENIRNEQIFMQVLEDFVHTEELKEELKPFAKWILDKLNSVKILDPACGSGAFPIGMLQKIISLKLSLFREVIEDRDVSIYHIKLETILNSIYGCDIQPMAVELSRLRCWLSLIIDEPVDKKKKNWGIDNLPNLDFKFVCVNTLIGLPEFSASFGISEEEFSKLKKIREDYFTAAAKQKESIEEEFKLEQRIIAEKHSDWSRKDSQAVTMLTNWDPFEISETSWFDPFWMFGIDNNFDIVIGNPPYVEHKKLKSFRECIKNQNFVTHSGSADLYVYFYERSIKLLKRNGILIFISSNKFFKTGYGLTLRKYLSNLQTISIVDFTDYHVFDALVASCVYLLRNVKASNQFGFISIREDFEGQNIYSYIEANKSTYPASLLKEKYWQFDDYNLFDIKYKIEKIGVPIKNIPTIKVFRGITTGFNEAFIVSKSKVNLFISTSKNNQEIIKPILQGRNIRRWIYNKSDEYLLLTYYNLDIPNLYPAIFKHLSEYEEYLKSRADQGVNWWNLRACSYYDEFEKPKIIWGLTADKWAFAFDNEKYYLPSNGYILTSSKIELKYILGILNSTLMQFYFRFIGIMTAGGAFTLKHQTINELPIKIPTPFEEYIISVLVDYILFTKNNPDLLNESITESKILLLEEILNGCVFELYFKEEMKEQELNILDLIANIIDPIKNVNDGDNWKLIDKFYHSLKETDNVVRNRMLRFETRSTKLILPIINSLK